MQRAQTIIEIRPFRGGWQCYEGPVVGPYWTGEHAASVALFKQTFPDAKLSDDATQIENLS
jgi:hypothetical protein